MAIGTKFKDPDSVLDYTIDWEDWLNGDTISSSTWTLETGITEDSNSFTSTSATVWISGGTINTRYTVNNQITTADGRTDQRTFNLYIRER